MRKALCLVAMLAFVASANATVDFFFSNSADPYGLKDPNLAFLHSKGAGYDFRDGYELMPAGGPYGVAPYAEPLADVELDPNSGNWAYIWARFNNEPAPSAVGAINGIAIKINGAASGVGNIAYYSLDNLSQTGIMAKKWDGEPAVFYSADTALIAVQTAGQRNTNADTPWQLFVGGAHRAFLLGAVKCPAVGTELTISISVMNYSGTATNPTPPPPTPRSLNKVVGIPEPASLLLLGLAGLVLRRR